MFLHEAKCFKAQDSYADRIQSSVPQRKIHVFVSGLFLARQPEREHFSIHFFIRAYMASSFPSIFFFSCMNHNNYQTCFLAMTLHNHQSSRTCIRYRHLNSDSIIDHHHHICRRTAVSCFGWSILCLYLCCWVLKYYSSQLIVALEQKIKYTLKTHYSKN